MMQTLAAAGPLFIVLAAFTREPWDIFGIGITYAAGGLSFAWFHYLRIKEVR